ncbi:MAG: flagellar protein FliT [Roseburia sp.]|nr:flagellar protein FliT [Roseburia sp.]
MENSLNILSESLDQKLLVLRDIQDYNAKQEEAFTKEQPDLESFDAAMEEKERLIERLTKLDDGFELLYQRLAVDLKDNKERYAVQIKELQSKIAKVTELGMTIQAQEARNKKLIEDYFAKERTGIRQGRMSSKAAYDYYKSMSGNGYGASRFMDSKN